MRTVVAVAFRLAISASLAVSGVIHAYLYVNGYRDIATIGPAFLEQAVVFCVLALLILAGGSDWPWQRPSPMTAMSGGVRNQPMPICQLPIPESVIVVETCRHAGNDGVLARRSGGL
jgi:hypothetical protein